MLGLSAYNHNNLKQKNEKIGVLEKRQKELNENLNSLQNTLRLAQTQIKATDEAYKALSVKLDTLDKNKSNYTEKVKEIRDANEDTRKLLDTRLPDDLKRLLNEAVQAGKY